MMPSDQRQHHAQRTPSRAAGSRRTRRSASSSPDGTARRRAPPRRGCARAPSTTSTSASAGLAAERDVGRQEGVLAADHVGAADVADLRHVGQRHLACRSRGEHEDAFEVFDVAAQFARIAHAHGIALAAFHGGGGHPANGRPDQRPARRRRSARSGRWLAVDGDLQIRLADDALGVDGGAHDGRPCRSSAARAPPPSGRASPGRAPQLEAHRRAHAALQHDLARLDGLELGRRGGAGNRRRLRRSRSRCRRACGCARATGGTAARGGRGSARRARRARIRRARRS
jgi:hypothetical protein